MLVDGARSRARVPRGRARARRRARAARSSLQLLEEPLGLVVLRCRHVHLDLQPQHPIAQVGATHERPQLVDARDGALLPGPARDALGADRRDALAVDEDDRHATWILLVERRRLGGAWIDGRWVQAVGRHEAEAVRVADREVIEAARRAPASASIGKFVCQSFTSNVLPCTMPMRMRSSPGHAFGIDSVGSRWPAFDMHGTA